MASLRLHLLLIVFILLEASAMFSSPVKADDEDDKLLQRINSYRMSLGLSALAENDNAECLADEIADQLEDRPCLATITSRLPEAQFSSYHKPWDHCHLHVNNTRDAAILISCIPGRFESLTTVFNFTDSLYSRYLNNSKYIGAGIDSEDEWIVVVLTTNTPGGSFVASSAAASSKRGLVSNLVALFLGTLMLLFNGFYV